MSLGNLDLKNITGLVSALSVAGILVLFAYKIDLDHRIAMGDQYQRHSEDRITQIQLNLTDDDSMDASAQSWEAGSRPGWWTAEMENNLPDNRSSRAIQKDFRNLVITQIRIDNQYYQYQLGLFDESYWLASRANLQRQLRDPMRRELYLNNSRNAAFNELMAELIAENSQE